MQNYIAVDIGASSGRLVLGSIKDNKLQFQEIHRFVNEFRKVDGYQRWDIDNIINQIIIGLKKVKKMGVNSVYLGIDSWGVDYVCIGEDGKKLDDPISYRDHRTNHSVREFSQIIAKQDIYAKTGIQFQSFNTLYQLFKENPTRLSTSKLLLLIPDYIGYVLTGKAVAEETNTSTSQLLNIDQHDFDEDLLAAVNVQRNQFPKLVPPGTVLGSLQDPWAHDPDLPETTVITVATHDTASAVVGTPAIGNDWAFLSSGTWSLLGRELTYPVRTPEALVYNYTNEWGANHTYRLLKNIMGLWVVQSVKKELQPNYEFAELAALACKVKPFQQFIDLDDDRFLNPDNMILEIQNYCRETNQVIPETPGELVNAIYSNLALIYALELKRLQQLTAPDTINSLYIVGGGSNIEFLNQLTSSLSRLNIVTGPNEASAVGNIIVQMITSKELPDIVAGRELIQISIKESKYTPKDDIPADILEQYTNFKNRKGVPI